jgi:tetratricopeptide (TPR) repeat protein
LRHSALGIAYAGLGKKEEAIREGQLAVELLPETTDAWAGLWRLEDLARIYVMVGEYDLAVEKLEYLLTIPSELSVPLVQLDPTWKPLHNHPRFKKLIE